MSVVADWALKVNVVETLSAGIDAAPTPNINHTGFSTRGTFTASSAVPVTVVSADEIALVAGAHTIDLEALPGTNGATVVGTGLKVQLFKFKNTGTNAMTIGVGAANGYELKGAGWTEILLAGQEMLFNGNELTPDVAGADSEIDIAGTAVETFQVIIVLG